MTDQWTVADSEDEDGLPGIIPRMAVESAGAGPSEPATEASTIQTFSIHPRTPEQGRPPPTDESLFTPPPARGLDSTIENFTSLPSPSRPPAPKPRPRPRVIMKKPQISNPDADSTTTPSSHISDPPISAMTDDSIRPATSTSFGLAHAVDDMYSSLDIAERAKMRSRKAQTNKKSAYIPPPDEDIIELTSDDDGLVSKPTKRQKKQTKSDPKPKTQPKPQPKARPKVKNTALLPPVSQPSRPIVNDPPIAQFASSSQFPPSTLPTLPSSTPPQSHVPTPPSSPAINGRKRKRTHASIAEDDELDIIGASRIDPSPTSNPPPFFAPSSSSAPTDSGIEIPLPEVPTRAGGKKKQTTKQTAKKAAQAKSQTKGRKSKKSDLVGEVAGDPGRISPEASTSGVHEGSALPEGQTSPSVVSSFATQKAAAKQAVSRKGKGRVIDSDEEDEESIIMPKSSGPRTPAAPSTAEDEAAGEEGRKETLRSNTPCRDPPPEHASTSTPQPRGSSVKRKSTAMSELIRRVNSQPSSPFPNASRPYSPFMKSSRTMLSRIAPLHPNRRTPPPPLPRPPPPKKSKKQLEMEERIEEELAETVDGWSCLTDEERKALRKARIDAVLGYE